MKVFDYKDYFLIYIPPDKWQSRNLSGVKQIPGAAYNKNKRMWWLPGLCRDKVIALKYSHRAQIFEGGAEDLAIPEIEPMPELEVEPPIKNITLRPYQKQGVARGLILKRYINGDEQGLGKTIQTITTIVTADQLGEDVFPALVICPASLKLNWKKEIETFSNETALILNNKVKDTFPNFAKMKYANFYITNYESMKSFFVHTIRTGKHTTSADIILKPAAGIFKSIIIDEAHRCRDTSTQQTRLCLRMAYGKKWVILLTGTPIVNKPLDLWPQISIMGHNNVFATTERQFKDRFCDGGNGASNLKALNAMLNKYAFFRREKKEVAKDLPEKQRQKLVCNITTRAEYEHAYTSFTNWLYQQDFSDAKIAKTLKAQALVQMNVLRAISARGKLAEASEFIDEIMDAGEKLILFCNLKEIVNSVVERYPHAVMITGSIDTEQRQRNVDRFQNDPKCQLIVCNIKAAGVGITLTASSRVAFLEFPWTYADCAQCEDRAHRIGQINNVMCTYFLGVDTIDEKMLDIILEKKNISQQITGATDEMEMKTVDKLLDLFNVNLNQNLENGTND
jgi:SWI/SNF-related matrix-associated actin-dependent regulator 1 of chromatin subfamily A